MVWSAEDVTDAELDLLALDYPIIVANQVAERPYTAVWSTGSGVTTDTDRAQSNYETWYLHDRSAHKRSRARTPDTELFIVFNLIDDQVFDTIAILNHDINSGADAEVEIEIADSSDFSSNLRTLIAPTSIEDDRHVFLDVGDDSTPVRFTDATFLRIRIGFSAPHNPEIGEIWIGQRRQLRAPARPYDHLGIRGEMRASGPAGALDMFEGHTGGLRFQISTRDVGEDTLRGIVTDSRSGTEPVLVIPRPYSDPHRAAICANAEQAIRVATIANPEYFEIQGLDLIESAPFLGAP